MLPKNRKLFLLDGAGALLSVLVLGVVLPALQAYLGMPLKELYFLAGIAALYSLYSFTCYALHAPFKPYLTLIAVANLAYCGITLALVGYYSALLTTIGIAYFIGEAAIIASLAFFEWQTAKRQ